MYSGLLDLDSLWYISTTYLVLVPVIRRVARTIKISNPYQTSGFISPPDLDGNELDNIAARKQKKCEWKFFDWDEWIFDSRSRFSDWIMGFGLIFTSFEAVPQLYLLFLWHYQTVLFLERHVFYLQAPVLFS